LNGGPSAVAAEKPRIQMQSFVNSDCEKTASCTLKRFEMRNEFYESADSYDVFTYTRYETDSVANLEDYGIVQFIRGCDYAVAPDGQSGVRKYLGLYRDFFGKHVPLFHPHWQIDTDDVDPLYASVPGAARRLDYHYWLPGGRWYGVSQDKWRLFKNGLPDRPSVFVFDKPTGAFKSGLDLVGWQNTSLEFKTCIYRMKDVPLVATPEQEEIGDPIHCFFWRSSAIYNSAEKKWDHPESIDPICGVAPERGE
jgi:hypothetical protein